MVNTIERDLTTGTDRWFALKLLPPNVCVANSGPVAPGGDDLNPQTGILLPLEENLKRAEQVSCGRVRKARARARKERVSAGVKVVVGQRRG